MKEFLILLAIMLLLMIAFNAMPDYDKYKAGEYRESIDCDGSAPYCFFVQFGNYKEQEGVSE